MLLSEAILKGSEGRGQCKYTLEDHLQRVCAHGAANIGKSGSSRPHKDRDWVSLTATICKICSKYTSGILTHLNDGHDYTFQQIIDYIKKENLDVELDAAK